MIEHFASIIYILKTPGMVTVKFTFTPKSPATFIYKVTDLQNMAEQCPTHPVDMHPKWPRICHHSVPPGHHCCLLSILTVTK